MNGVDAKGMAGAQAEYHENWFEYLKAAGIITMFSLANAKMAEEAARYVSSDMAAGAAFQPPCATLKATATSWTLWILSSR